MSLLFAPTDPTVSYLFNSRSKHGNEPIFTITAIPEPGVGFFCLEALSSVAVLGRWRRENGKKVSLRRDNNCITKGNRIASTHRSD